MSGAPGAVTVACRVRPRVIKADADGSRDCIEAGASDSQRVTCSSGSTFERVHEFGFDRVFGSTATQEDVFCSVALPLVDATMQGFNSTIMAYGQTASGKTYSLSGTPSEPGISPRVADAIFDRIMDAPDTHEFTIRVSCLEIYMERVRDLLKPSTAALLIRQDYSRGVFVDGASEQYVASSDELKQLLYLAEANRMISATGMNDTSSRSHCIIAIHLSVRDTQAGTIQTSKLHLVDLAGSESVQKTHAEGLTLDEAKMINRSLFTLAKVVHTLSEQRPDGGGGVLQQQPPSASEGSSEGSSPTPAAAAKAAAMQSPAKAPPHIPYRDSKLTRLLQDSLGGNARTALLVCCSPCGSHSTETLSTLRFAMRAKDMPNRAVVNRVRSVEELERLLHKAEKAIDAQAHVILALQEQLTHLTALARPGWREVPQARTLYALEASPSPAGSSAGASHGVASPRGKGSSASSPSPLPLPLGSLSPHAARSYGDDPECCTGRSTAAGGGSAAAAHASSSSTTTSAPGLGGLSSPAPGTTGATDGFAVVSNFRRSSAPGMTLVVDLVDRTMNDLGMSRDRSARRVNEGEQQTSADATELLVETTLLRDEVARLTAAQAASAEELDARNDEIRGLTDLLNAREEDLRGLRSEMRSTVAEERKHAAGGAVETLLGKLKEHVCTVCEQCPFAGATDASSLTILHDAQCFTLAETRKAIARLESRAAVLQAEVSALKEVEEGRAAVMVRQSPMPAAASGAAADGEGPVAAVGLGSPTSAVRGTAGPRQGWFSHFASASRDSRSFAPAPSGASTSMPTDGGAGGGSSTSRDATENEHDATGTSHHRRSLSSGASSSADHSSEGPPTGGVPLSALPTFLRVQTQGSPFSDTPPLASPGTAHPSLGAGHGAAHSPSSRAGLPPLPKSTRPLERAEPADARNDAETPQVATAELQRKLASLMHAHRQLLRKYAVVDVEVGEMQEALYSRELRIGELTRAALEHGAALERAEEDYGARLRALEAQHAEVLTCLREALVLAPMRRLQHDAATAASASGGNTVASDSSSSSSSSSVTAPPAASRSFSRLPHFFTASEGTLSSGFVSPFHDAALDSGDLALTPVTARVARVEPASAAADSKGPTTAVTAAAPAAGPPASGSSRAPAAAPLPQHAPLSDYESPGGEGVSDWAPISLDTIAVRLSDDAARRSHIVRPIRGHAQQRRGAPPAQQHSATSLLGSRLPVPAAKVASALRGERSADKPPAPPGTAGAGLHAAGALW